MFLCTPRASRPQCHATSGDFPCHVSFNNVLLFLMFFGLLFQKKNQNKNKMNFLISESP